jgi:hypothetical protein
MLVFFLYIIFIFLFNMVLVNLLPFVESLSIFSPMLFLGLMPFLFMLIKNKKIYFLIVGITSFIIDMLYSEYFLFIFILLMTIAIFNYLFFKKISFTFFNLLLVTILNIIIFDSIIFFSLVIFFNYKYEFFDLIYKISHSLILNLIYVSSLYFLFSRKFGDNKRLKYKK